MRKRKKIFYHSDGSAAKTGFGGVTKRLLEYLYKTNKYEIVNFACGVSSASPNNCQTPWLTIGAIPSSEAEVQAMQSDAMRARAASYGMITLDDAIRQEKPDFYFGVQDIWGIAFAAEKPWFNSIHTILWSTLDSLPLHELALKLAPKCKNFWVWSNFAEKEHHRLGHKHVKTVHGPIDEKHFFPLEKHKKLELRKRFNIDKDTFIIGDVFRNQLRKSVPNLLEGWAMFKKDTHANAKLLLHTHWSEGWKIHQLADEYGVSHSDILTTYICANCNEYEIKPFTGEGQNCPYCKTQKSQITTSPKLGVSEEQLNEIYNLMDGAAFPFTSGGLEIPIYEAKLCGLVTLVTNYSCGEEACEPEANSLPLDWSEYREFESHFRKASTSPSSICKQLKKLYEMPDQKRREMGLKARQWTLDNFTISKIGPIFEEFLDSHEPTGFNWEFNVEQKDPNAQIPDNPNDKEWLVSLYHNILRARDVTDSHKDVLEWADKLKEGANRQSIEAFFRKTAHEFNAKNQKVEFTDILDKDDAGKRILIVMPEAIGDLFMVTSLFQSAKTQYPNYNLYVATKPENFDVLKGNPHVHKTIPYIQQMESQTWLEGIGGHNGYFELAFLPFIQTQRQLNYLNNGKTNIAFNLQ